MNVPAGGSQDREPGGGTLDQGGDPACWLASVCPDCGRLVVDRQLLRCPRCNARLGDDEP